MLKPPPPVYNRANRCQSVQPTVTENTSELDRGRTVLNVAKWRFVEPRRWKTWAISSWNPAVFRRAGRDHST
jgi:hypothetical protein